MAFDYTKLITRGKTALSGVSWQLLFLKLTTYIAIAVAIATVAYREGKHDCEIASAKQYTVELSQQISKERTVIREELIRRSEILERRLSTISGQSQEAAKLRADIQIIRGKLDEAIMQRPANAACAPTDDELRQYGEIAERTRKRK